MNIDELTPRQRVAIQHPTVETSYKPRFPHGSTYRRQGQWKTILEVRKTIDARWLWMASVSRMRFQHVRTPKTLTLSQWEQGWLAEADAILLRLLHGVGGENVDLYTMLEALKIPHDEMSSHQMWRVMADEEVDLAKAWLPS